LTVEFFALRFRVSLDTEVKGHQEQVLTAEASIDRQRFAHRSHHQTGANQQHERKRDLFPKGEAMPAEVISCASFFFNGGTVFEPWMEKALELVDGSQFGKADVICVSDGISDVSLKAQAEWTRRRAERGMRAYGVLIGSNQGEALLDEISDAVFRLDDLRGDLPALEVIFSAV